MRLSQVGKRYGPRRPWVLRSVELTVAPGTLTQVRGGNGSGKSTLLKVAAGVCAPTRGQVSGRGRTGYVPERFPPALPFAVTGYLTHLGRVHGLSSQESVRRSREWIDRLDLGRHARTRLGELSKGNSQKVAAAQALLAAPDLLVLDEAWTGLDAAARTVLDEAVLERVAAGGAAIFADHDPRRLAGALTAAYRVEGGTLAAEPLPADARAVPVLIEMANLPADVASAALPGQPEIRPAGPGLTILRTTDACSDALLRHLLAAYPEAHLRSVRHIEPTGGAA